MWSEINVTYPFLNFRGATVEVVEWMSNFHAALFSACNYLPVLGLKLIHVCKMGHWYHRTTHRGVWLGESYKKSVQIMTSQKTSTPHPSYGRAVEHLFSFLFFFFLFWKIYHEIARVHITQIKAHTETTIETKHNNITVLFACLYVSNSASFLPITLVLFFFSYFSIVLTHWGWHKMTTIFRTTFFQCISLNENKCIAIMISQKTVLRVQLTIFQHWFR